MKLLREQLRSRSFTLLGTFQFQSQLQEVSLHSCSSGSPRQALPTGYVPALGAVSAVMKSFLESGFALPAPLQPLGSSGHTWQNCLGQQGPERGAILSCVSAPFGSWLQCHSLCPVLGTKQGNKDHSQNLHIFLEWIEKPSELSAPKKPLSSPSQAKGKPAPSHGAHKLLDVFPALFKASPWGQWQRGSSSSLLPLLVLVLVLNDEGNPHLSPGASASAVGWCLPGRTDTRAAAVQLSRKMP